MPEGIEIGGKVFLIVDPQFAKMLSTGNVARKGTYEELEGLTASASASDVPIGIRAKAKKSQKKVASTETYSITPFIVQALFFKLSASMSYDFGNSFYDGYDINTENSFEFKSDVIAEGGLLQPLQPEGTGYRFVGQTGQVIASKFTIKQEEGGWRIFCLQEDQRRDLNIIGDVGGVMCYVSNSRIDQNTPKFPSPFNRFKVEAYRTGPQDA
ncbi:hypothetical protein HZC09_06815 [Candidatus Micrarchaeota archaeon]|nr:hypothetical protein [Candidatus Micrarchaeota archaeon]